MPELPELGSESKWGFPDVVTQVMGDFSTQEAKKKEVSKSSA